MEKYIIMGTNKSLTRHILYYNGNKKNPTEEDILSSFRDFYYVKKFNVSEYEPYEHKGRICNDSKMHVLDEGDGMLYVWQVMGKLTDFNGEFVPNTYEVRRVALLVND